MVIREVDLRQAETVLFSHGFSKRGYKYSQRHHAYFKLLEREIVSFDIQIGGVCLGDAIYLSEEDILGHRVKNSFFYVPSDNDTWIMLVIHSLIGKEYFKEEYKKVITSPHKNIDQHYAISKLETVFTLSAAKDVYRLVSERKFEALLRRRRQLSCMCLMKSWNNFSTVMGYFIRGIIWERPFRFYPLISIIGPDGAGKTTLTEKLAAHLRNQNRKVKVVYVGRGRANFLPMTRIGRAYKHHEKSLDERRAPRVVQRKVFYTLMALVFTLDLGLRYLWEILPARCRYRIVISDRYCSDILLMKYVPVWLKKILLTPFPKPTMTFYLYNTPEVLHQRREGEPVEELQRQLDLFELLVPQLQAERIKTTDPEKNTTEVIQKVMSHVYFNWY